MTIDSEKFIEYCKAEKEATEAKLRSFLRSDGIPKKGCSIGVAGCGDHIRGYELSIENMKRYTKSMAVASEEAADSEMIQVAVMEPDGKQCLLK